MEFEDYLSQRRLTPAQYLKEQVTGILLVNQILIKPLKLDLGWSDHLILDFIKNLDEISLHLIFNLEGITPWQDCLERHYYFINNRADDKLIAFKDSPLYLLLQIHLKPTKGLYGAVERYRWDYFLIHQKVLN